MATRSSKRRIDSLTKPVHLPPEVLRRLSKPRRGFIAHAEHLFELYAERVDELSIRGQTPRHAVEQLEAYRALLGMECAAKEQLKRIKDTRALRAAGVWSTMLDIYALARALGRSDIALRGAIADFARFMKHKARKKSAPVSSRSHPGATADPTRPSIAPSQPYSIS